MRCERQTTNNELSIMAHEPHSFWVLKEEITMPKGEYVPEDPLELVGMVLPGEAGTLEAMAECFIEEYVRMGWDETRLMTLFTSPMFLATHRIYCQMGEESVRGLIRRVWQKWGGAFSSGASSRWTAEDQGSAIPGRP